MDTPEGDVSAIQSGRVEPLPTYQEHDEEQCDIHPLISTVDPLDTRHLPPSYLKEPTDSDDDIEEALEFESVGHVQDVPTWEIPDHLEQARKNTIGGFFEAIDKEQDDAIALFISRNLVTANTTTDDGKTALLAAVATKNVRIVQQLLDCGAEPDAFGVISKVLNSDPADVPYTVTKRTPLQLAASIGHLPLVKLFMEVYHCDDSLVAPDGQIALRLAAANGHREIVDYLPVRRGGGFLRWQTQHKKAILRAKRALKKIYHFIKFFVWDVEKFFLWTCPKHCIVKPLIKGCTWCWERRKGFGSWCKSQVQQMPQRAERFGKWIWKGVKKVPKAAAKATKAVWKFTTEGLPTLLKDLGKFVWSLVTTRIPRVIAILAKWIWGGVTSTGKAIWNAVLQLVSLLHTISAAIVTFFRELTLQDIWNGFCAVFHAIFGTLPKTIWSWVKAFGEASYKAMKAMFGTTGKILWWLCCGLAYIAVYVPTKLWTVIESLGGSFAKAWYEVLVWISPKA